MANRKTVMADKMSMHFAEVGHVQSRHEYIRSGGGPYTPQQITRVCGSWNRMVGLCRNLFPDRLTISAQAAEVPQPVKKEEPRVDIPPRTENDSVRTAEQALARLGKENE